MSMLKLIHSGDFDPSVDVSMRLMDTDPAMKKQASTIFGCDYSDMKPDKDHVGIHVVALGDYEHYGMNRNSDAFEKSACEKFYDTFVKYGHVYRHHRNKDPKKAIGTIKAAAYNDKMGRIELFIHADKEKAAPELERLEKEGEVSFSMACRVAQDRCFTKGTQVLTSKGFKNIENVCVGDRVITAEAQERAVTATMCRMTNALTRVSVRGIPDDVECTPNHPFNVVSVNKIRSCRGTVRGTRRRHTPRNSTTTCVSCGREIDVSSEWKQAVQLVEGDYIKEKIDSSSEHIVRGVSFAYLCGMYAGDGSALWSTSGHDSLGDTEYISALHISASANPEDQGILDKISDAYKKCTGKEATIHRESGGKNAYIVSFTDRLFAERVVSLIGMYSKEKYIDSEILGWSVDEKAAFVAGYIDSDGAFGFRNNRPVIRICSINKGLLFSTQRLLWALGVPATVGVGNNLENMRVSTYRHTSTTYHVFFSKAPDILIKASDKLSRKYRKDKEGQGGSGILLISGYAYLPVSGSRTFESETVPVYNLEVEDDHTYIAEGLGVHNCSICGNLRKQAGDNSECDHIRDHFGELMDDGRKVFTFNPEPQFFDISFVGRPADRIAWNLKVASGLPVDSVKAAELEGVTAPDILAITDAKALRKLEYAKQLSDMHKSYRGWVSKTAAVLTVRDKYLYSLRKIASSKLSDDILDKLRELPPKMAFSVLGNAGVVMDVPTFFKYAMGPEYRQVDEYIPGVMAKVASVIDDLVASENCQDICNDTTFDSNGYKDAKLEAKIASEGIGNLEDRIILASVDDGPKFIVDTVEQNCSNGIISKLAQKYAAYELSAIDAVLNSRNDIDKDTMLALSASHNLQEH